MELHRLLAILSEEILIYFLCFSLSQSFPTHNCGYDACDLGKRGFLNVHLIPHTHDDVGWLKTVDQYYYGSMNHIQRAGVQYILDSVVDALAADPARRFTYVEVAFFDRWWRSQPDSVKQLVKNLVNSGQLQFALGAWSMSDEATVFYSDAIDQMTRGRATLRTLFGECGNPLVSWQIDPFGHARDHAELFRESGLDAVFFQRMDYREKSARRETKSLEVLWDTGTQPNGTAYGLFTSMLYDTYCYPPTFCFDDKCDDEPIMDDSELRLNNVDERVEQFLQYINKVRNAFSTNHILVPMGCDFTYENANVNFKNTDKLIRYVNRRQSQGSDVNLLYSTPQCYTKAVNIAFQQMRAIDLRRGDFFPYASGPNSYWTGYYSSRPALKAYVRQTSTLLTMCEQIHLFANRILSSSNREWMDAQEEYVDSLRRAMGVLQHHDAVTGTEKQLVADDYALTLSRASTACQAVISHGMLRLMPNLLHLTGGALPAFCDLLNISLCTATEGYLPYLNSTGKGGVYIFVYNPNGWSLWNEWVRIPIYIDPLESNQLSVVLYDVRAAGKNLLSYQIVPINKRTMQIPERQASARSANTELVFNLGSSGLPTLPMGFTTLHLSISKQKAVAKSAWSHHSNPSRCVQAPLVSQTTALHLEVGSSPDPLVIVAEHLATGTQLRLTVEMLYYFGETNGMQSSGAYVFLPKNKDMIQKFETPSFEHLKGACVEEVYLNYSHWASLVVRLYNNGELEVQWTAGPIPDGWRQFSRELIIRYTVQGDAILPQTTGEFYTDSAGRRLIKRVRHMRPDWNISQVFRETQPVAGNYYPIVNRIMLKGSSSETSFHRETRGSWPAMGFAVYTDRAQGGSSLQDGQVELMVHRRLVRDDGYGVGEPLTENGVDHNEIPRRGCGQIF
ncbi:unnamed protein product [Dicrocoelium dendriticum]|nr:unnamed protein product [Dicrocoelium dendriticum]